MRRIVTICLAFVLSSVLVKAQELIQGSFGSLMNTRVVTVQLDLSQACVEGAPLEDFLGLMSFEDGAQYQAAFQKDLRDILADFIDEFNDTNCPILLTVSPKPDTAMTIRVKEISRKGNCISCDYQIASKADNKPILTITMTSKDGRIGSFTNLMGDAFERAGKDLGKYIKKQLKNENKKKQNN